MTFVYGLLMFFFILVFMYSMIRCIDSNNPQRKEDLFRAVIMVALIIVIKNIWR